ncbi:hypothetical protein [Micrococcus luteus]|uniref:hypothetical protein n=1 Tax=Micrococcus luteus TaxID=1270 RepID=UPI0024B25BD2|nr:hypothetical protein [Micrococcus luteus]
MKLLAIAERGRAADGAEGAVLRVHPTLLPREHPLASARGVQRRLRGGRERRRAHVLRSWPAAPPPPPR